MSCSTKVRYQNFSDPWVEQNDNFPTSATGLFGALYLENLTLFIYSSLFQHMFRTIL